MKTLSNIFEFVKTGAIKEEYVDLGFPSGTLWCTHNIGAKEPYEYGEYFQWGSVEDNSRTKCSKDNEPFRNKQPELLPPENDVVYQRTNGKAYMPTQKDVEELFKHTTIKSCKYSEIDPDSGCDIAGTKLIGPNNNFIFIPYTGIHIGNITHLCDKCGYLWTSTRDDLSLAYFYYVSSDNPRIDISAYHQYVACSVRGVKSK